MSGRAILLITFVGIIAFVAIRVRRAAQRPRTPSAIPRETREDIGKALRHVMLITPAEETGEKPTDEFPRIYGVLMDWPLDDFVATVFATSSGAASLYTSGTLGIAGGELREKVRAAAMNFVRAADRYYDTSTPTSEFPYPDIDHVRFYFLTFDGVRVMEVDSRSVGAGGTHAEFFYLGQAVLTELRRASEEDGE